MEMYSKEVLINGFFGDVATSRSRKTTLIGSVFHEDKKLEVDELEAFFFKEVNTQDKLFSFLERLNGFFSFVVREGDIIYLVCDKLRSRPLFYTVDEGVEVSDDYYHILKKPKLIKFNVMARQEFLKTGYVTSSETLLEDVFQLEAAQIVKIDCVSCKIEKQNYCYFIPEKNVIDNKVEKFWFEKLDRALKKAIDRLISVAEGKKILIPLSGGYDSRILALYLKKSGYKDLLAFTFGNESSHEIAMSRRIAESLDIKWCCVNYSRKMWNTIKNSDEFREYIRRIGSGVSVANVQAFPAIKNLIEKGLVDENCIVVPGHTGDFIAGGHFRKKDLERGLDIDYAVEMIARRHYKSSVREFPKIRDRIINSPLFNGNIQNLVSVALAESWECRERQSKFISNSNRYYDFFGLSWWMPLWDNEFVFLWEEVPYNLRLNTRLWVNFVNTSMREYAGNSAPLGRSDPPAGIPNRIKGLLNYFYDPNGLYTLVPFTRWFLAKSRLSKKPGTVFGVLAEKYCICLENELSQAVNND